MNVLLPQLIWIENRCYRINNSIGEKAQPLESSPTEYMEEDLYGDSDELQQDYEIEMENGRYKNSFHVPQVFFSQIIGVKGMTRRRIESETKAQIKVPKPGVNGDIILVGPTRDSIITARTRIEIIVLAARNKQQFTHFLSIPFTGDKIKKNFIKFRDEIISDTNIFGLEQSLFQNPNKLHLTIVTLCLMDNEDRSLCAELLQHCKYNIIEPAVQSNGGRITLKMIGVEYMNDDPSAIDVLYGKIESDSLQSICNDINEYFIQKGVTQKKNNFVKMHVTLINSLFRDDNTSEGSQSNSTKRQTFDARMILKKYENYDFGSQDLTEIHLSQRYSTSCDGFYEATGILKL